MARKAGQLDVLPRVVGVLGVVHGREGFHGEELKLVEGLGASEVISIPGIL
jgi:hypothetical protein